MISNTTIKVKSLLAMAFCYLMSGVSFASQADQAIEELENGDGPYETMRTIIGILFMVGILVSIGKMMHIGIKYITTSAGGRGSAKEALLPWFIGAVCLALFWSLSTWLLTHLEIGPSGGGIFDIDI